MFTLDTPLTLAETSERYHYQAAPSQAAPAVSILTVASDAGADWAALAACLQRQSLQQWEWLIALADVDRMDSGLAALADSDPRVRLLGRHAQSQAMPVEQALATTTCEYICCLDTSSRIEPTFLEKCCWLLASNPNIAFCNTHSTIRGAQRSAWEYGFEQRGKFLDENYAGPTYVIKRSALALVAGPAAALPAGFEQWDRWLRLAQHGLWGYTIAESLTVYDQRDERAPFRPAEVPASFRRHIGDRYGGLKRQFPQASLADTAPYEQLDDTLPFQNRLAKPAGTKRLLILMPWLIVGGAERVNLDIIRQLTSADYEVSFATTLLNAQHGWLAEFARYTCDIFLLDHFLRMPDFPRFLVYLIQSRQIDTVMVSNSYLGYQLLPYLRAHCPEATFVDYCHSEHEEWKNGGYPRAGAAYQELLDLNIVSSLHIKNWMVQRGAEPGRIEVCYTNVDVEKWRPDSLTRQQTRQALGLAEDTALIIFVGRLSAEKRPQLLAKIVRELQDSDQGRFLCLVLGDGPERGPLEYQVRSLHLQGSMRLLGRVNDEDLYRYMAAADIFVLPSAVEGISVAIFEAMAVGLVPVGARVGGQSELVIPECGTLIAPGPNELAEYTGALRRLIHDPALRRQMGLAARARVEQHFPLAALGPRMAELFDKAAALHRDHPRPQIGPGLGREAATQAIEYTRLEYALDQLWRERESWRANPRPHPTIVIPPATRRRRLALFVYAKTVRWYHWGLEHGMDWLVPVKERAVSWAKRNGW